MTDWVYSAGIDVFAAEVLRVIQTQDRRDFPAVGIEKLLIGPVGLSSS